MLQIKILGPGCANCKRLEQMTQQVLEELKVEATVTKLTKPAEFLEYDVFTTPGLVIGEQAVCSGRIPSMEELTDFIKSAAG